MSGEWGATYRLQVHTDFPLSAAAKTLPYLATLGITHVYLSPCLQAEPGSQHGYDVTKPGQIADDLGGEEAYRNLRDRAERDLNAPPVPLPSPPPAPQ